MNRENLPHSAQKPVIRLSAVNDEPSRTWNLNEALDVLDELGTKCIELRAIDQKWIDDLSESEWQSARETLAQRGFVVTVYMSQLGQISVENDDGWPSEAARMMQAIRRAEEVGTRLIRTMGYRREAASRATDERTIGYLARLTEMARSADKTLILENNVATERSMSGPPRGCLEILERVDSPHLRMNLDPGNFSFYGHDPMEGFELLQPYTANVHVKDCLRPFDRSSYCLAGDGVTRYPEIFAGLARAGYEGCITVEPHLLHHETRHFSGAEGFVAAGRRIAELAQNAGFEVVYQ